MEQTTEEPNLHFISHLPNTVHGDQLLNQMFRCMPTGSWLFKYGRVPLSFLMTESIWDVSHSLFAPHKNSDLFFHSKRASAGIKNGTRCKLSVIAEAVSNCTQVIPSSVMQYNDHFYPTIATDDEVPGKKKKSTGRQSGVPYVAVNIEPKAKSVCQVFSPNSQMSPFDVYVGDSSSNLASWTSGISCCGNYLFSKHHLSKRAFRTSLLCLDEPSRSYLYYSQVHSARCWLNAQYPEKRHTWGRQSGH